MGHKHCAEGREMGRSQGLSGPQHHWNTELQPGSLRDGISKINVRSHRGVHLTLISCLYTLMFMYGCAHLHIYEYNTHTNHTHKNNPTTTTKQKACMTAIIQREAQYLFQSFPCGTEGTVGMARTFLNMRADASSGFLRPHSSLCSQLQGCSEL